MCRTLEANLSAGRFSEIALEVLRKSGFTVDETAIEIRGNVTFWKISHKVEQNFGLRASIDPDESFSLSITFHPESLLGEITSETPGFFSLWGPDESDATWDELTPDQLQNEVAAAISLWLSNLLLGLYKFRAEHIDVVDSYFSKNGRQKLFHVDCSSFHCEIKYQTNS